jgi:hypothetical protein
MHPERAQVDRLLARAVGAENVDLSVAQQVQPAIRRREGAAGPDRPEDTLARVDDEREACRERGERDDDDRGALNVGSAACR